MVYNTWRLYSQKYEHDKERLKKHITCNYANTIWSAATHTKHVVSNLCIWIRPGFDMPDKRGQTIHKLLNQGKNCHNFSLWYPIFLDSLHQPTHTQTKFEFRILSQCWITSNSWRLCAQGTNSSVHVPFDA